MAKDKVITVEEPYTLRKLQSRDIVPMATIINKIGFKEFVGCLKRGNDGKPLTELNVETIGMDIAFDMLDIILRDISKVEKDVFKFLANISNTDEKTISELDLPVFMQMLIDIFEKEEFGDFFKVASKLFK